MLSNLSISRILLLASLLFCPLLLFPQGKAVRVSASERDIVLDYYPSAYKPQKVSINAQSYFYFPESELTSKAGEPGLPAESFLIGIPASGSVDVELIEEQLSEPKRGFSFRLDGPLDMRMDQDQEFDAVEIVNNYSESNLERIFSRYGEEKFSRRIAREITASRQKKKIRTVGDLLAILEKVIPKRMYFQKKHPATKVFQALRIEVNGELEQLDQALVNIVQNLNPGGRLGVITFHSLEDRIVKHTFLKLQNPCECPRELPCVCGKKPLAMVITKKPVIPNEKEIEFNPRARSAKLRVIERL